MKEVEVDGVKYVPKPETRGCDGCVGGNDPGLCMALPVGCSEHRIIWVRKD